YHQSRALLRAVSFKQSGTLLPFARAKSHRLVVVLFSSCQKTRPPSAVIRWRPLHVWALARRQRGDAPPAPDDSRLGDGSNSIHQSQSARVYSVGSTASCYAWGAIGRRISRLGNGLGTNGSASAHADRGGNYR